MNLTKIMYMLRHALVLIFILTCTGCGLEGPDLITTVKDNVKGLKPGSSAIWRGAEVGQIKSVDFVDGTFRIEIALKPEFRGQIRSGAKALPVNSIENQFKPEIYIIGGDDPTAAPLKKGEQIEEASTLEFAINESKQWQDSVMLLIAGIAICILAIGKLSRYF